MSWAWIFNTSSTRNKQTKANVQARWSARWNRGPPQLLSSFSLRWVGAYFFISQCSSWWLRSHSLWRSPYKLLVTKCKVFKVGLPEWWLEHLFALHLIRPMIKYSEDNQSSRQEISTYLTMPQADHIAWNYLRDWWISNHLSSNLTLVPLYPTFAMHNTKSKGSSSSHFLSMSVTISQLTGVLVASIEFHQVTSV